MTSSATPNGGHAFLRVYKLQNPMFNPYGFITCSKLQVFFYFIISYSIYERKADFIDS